MTHHAVRTLALTAALFTSAVLPTAQAAEAYPTRSIHIIDGYAPGGTTDLIGRYLAKDLSTRLRKTVLLENRPGVAAMLGARAVAQAKPDGYTLFIAPSGPISFNPAVYTKLPYSPVNDFAPLGRVAVVPLVLVTSPSNPARTLADLVAFSKEHPDKANYSSSSTSFQLATELFNSKSGAKYTYVPYKGSAASITAVMSGEVTLSIASLGTAAPYITAGKLNAIAIAGAERVPGLPDVPTLRELGLDIDIELWAGMFAPKDTPQPILSRLETELAAIVADPDYQAYIRKQMMEPAWESSGAFAKRINAEIEQWSKVAQENGIKLD